MKVLIGLNVDLSVALKESGEGKFAGDIEKILERRKHSGVLGTKNISKVFVNFFF